MLNMTDVQGVLKLISDSMPDFQAFGLASTMFGDNGKCGLINQDRAFVPVIVFAATLLAGMAIGFALMRPKAVQPEDVESDEKPKVARRLSFSEKEPVQLKPVSRSDSAPVSAKSFENTGSIVTAEGVRRSARVRNAASNNKIGIL